MVAIEAGSPRQRYVKGPSVTTTCVLISPVMLCTRPLIATWHRIEVKRSETKHSQYGQHRPRAASLWKSSSCTVHHSNLWTPLCIFISHGALRSGGGQGGSAFRTRCVMASCWQMLLFHYQIQLWRMETNEIKNFTSWAALEVNVTQSRRTVDRAGKDKQTSREDSKVSAVDSDPASFFQPLSSRWPLTPQSLTRSLVGLFLCCVL